MRHRIPSLTLAFSLVACGPGAPDDKGPPAVSTSTTDSTSDALTTSGPDATTGSSGDESTGGVTDGVDLTTSGDTSTGAGVTTGGSDPTTGDAPCDEFWLCEDECPAAAKCVTVGGLDVCVGPDQKPVCAACDPVPCSRTMPCVMGECTTITGEDLCVLDGSPVCAD